MRIDGEAWRTIGLAADGCSVWVIDQTQLPHRLETRTLRNCEQAAEAISTMVVRGAPLIGVTGAYGLMLALQQDPGDQSLEAAVGESSIQDESHGQDPNDPSDHPHHHPHQLGTPVPRARHRNP